MQPLASEPKKPTKAPIHNAFTKYCLRSMAIRMRRQCARMTLIALAMGLLDFAISPEPYVTVALRAITIVLLVMVVWCWWKTRQAFSMLRRHERLERADG